MKWPQTPGKVDQMTINPLHQSQHMIPQTSRDSITWETVRNANHQVPSWTYWNQKLWEAHNLCFDKISTRF